MGGFDGLGREVNENMKLMTRETKIYLDVSLTEDKLKKCTGENISKTHFKAVLNLLVYLNSFF